METVTDDSRWRPDRNPKTGKLAWRRFRGRGKRGRTPGWQAFDDDLDIRLALGELVTARQQLRAAHAVADRTQRRAAVTAAIGKIALAVRLLDSVVERRAGVCSDVLDGES